MTTDAISTAAAANDGAGQPRPNSGNSLLGDQAGRDVSQTLLAQVQEAIARKTPLRIAGGGTKSFYGCQTGAFADAQPIDVREHQGIVDYDPSELVITVRAGTRLSQLNAVLKAGGQMLACEPPSFGDNATVGGMVAAGLSGPRRPWAGSVRDFVLGARLISGFGTQLRFGGAVMKNVAGYDVSRLLAGSLGCLGLMTEFSFKVLPLPRNSQSVRLEMSAADALAKLRQWGQQPLPITAAAHDGQSLFLRFEGNEGSVAAARTSIGGEAIAADWWDALRELQLPFFTRSDDARPLWRLSVPAWAAPMEIEGSQFLDWGGAQRWLRSDAPAEVIRAAAAAVGGHASCWTAGHIASPLHPLAAPVLQLHRQLKAKLDPSGIFNPQRMYPDF